ncbi:hypothetical protein N7495_008377 [Penicillium taxi]|uniref:uncharacterized protein n=1 Tax=Penicillium taxi TaxID=168475 RepID=UPI00254551C0|nr:uncharacterized protein N7495_008377 [Penicillium taxi]KAJ5888336.1 hypothetical protein N7495_008377 [Penicillium taxi]
MSEVSRDKPTYLEPPSKTTEIEDPGAEDACDTEDEHFSDASEGQAPSQLSPHSRSTSPVPRTRVERVDSNPKHGELPGTEAYEKRKQDSVPDEIEIVPEGTRSRSHSVAGLQDQPLIPGDSPIPQTMVEKVDPESPSYGEVPGTDAYEKRQADAVPDVVTKASTPENEPSSSPGQVSPGANNSDQIIPETILTKVDTLPAEDDLLSRPRAHRKSPSDAEPDVVETIQDTPLLQSSHSPKETLSLDGAAEPEPEPEPELVEDDDDDDGFGGDDFDEFVEEQDDMGDDDFGDFDDGFQEPSSEITGDVYMGGGTVSPRPCAPISAPPLTDFESFKSSSELISALQGTLDSLLPASRDFESLPPVELIPDSAAIFSTERSLSLWSQLVAPPPLQPQNWVKSRIRRLFLVSLGVPVDLDEILPASKQKKLILPSINLDSSTSASTTSQNQAQKTGDVSVDNTGQAPSRSKSTRRGALPPPELDLSAVRRLCATTDAALGGWTDEELKLHVRELEQAALRASTVLEHWLKRRDGLLGEKEAFEGVIENLVSHVRRVRK